MPPFDKPSSLIRSLCLCRKLSQQGTGKPVTSSFSQKSPTGLLCVRQDSRRGVRRQKNTLVALISTAPRDKERVPGLIHHPYSACQPNQGAVKSQLVFLVPGTCPPLPCRALNLLPPLLEPLRALSTTCPILEIAFFVDLGGGEETWLYLFLLKPCCLGTGDLEQERRQGSYRRAPTLERFLQEHSTYFFSAHPLEMSFG